jgi:hypothetical protein
MHDFCGIVSVMKKHKWVIVLLSIHALSVDFFCQPIPYVTHRDGAHGFPIPISSICLENTTFISGIDVVDQLHACCPSQSHSHKWWHEVFWFLLNTRIVNMSIKYL